MKKTYDTTLEIAAPAAQVWKALTDFPRYGDWNTALPSISGDLRVGSTLALTLALGGKAMPVTATVEHVAPETRFSWRGNMVTAFLFSGFREFTLEAVGPGSTRVRHVESLSGLLVRPFMLAKGKAVAEHHHGFNRCIKQRAEELAKQAS